ncbi:alkaline phosphatase [Gilliamella sp. wkB178]|uniref:DeoR/GlpR family DNA-binding transcription regulator n=1 Tax=Gilliamella sp. wkB178 TaxID=3120259 RepID=UPI00080E61B4|nr:DeoR/GlpR family DNA-binding transcription regulator [Gilliamella apicola]OCG06905.1 alkaline phosphatase [Gilliamella apicola]
MTSEQRRDFIYNYLHQHNEVSFKKLSSLLNTSHMTIRRDSKILEEEGKVTPIFGGIKLNNILKLELSYREKAELNTDIKRKLGICCSSLIESGQTIYLDAGTTLFNVAKQIAKSPYLNLTVITNDFTICNYLIDMPHITLYHTGGLVNSRNYSCMGNSAANFFNLINIDIAFLSSSSWDLKRGMSTPDEGKSSVKKAVIKASRRKVLVSDSSKFGKYGLFHICDLNQLTDIVTDNQLLKDDQQKIIEQSIALHLIKD